MDNAELKADALAKAAMQAAARAMHTAQLAADAYRAAADRAPHGHSGPAERTLLMERMRDALLDAYATAPAAERNRMLACKATITSDELIDLLALCVKG